MKLDLGDIKVLSTMEAIRKRPTMYIGSITDPKALTMLIIETMCLSRALSVDCGAVTEINIKVKNGNEVTITDNGPGIEMKKVPNFPGDKYLLDSLLTDLHACKGLKHETTSEFCKVGIVVVNAMSEYFHVTNCVNQIAYVFSYVNGELVRTPFINTFVKNNGLIFKFKFDSKIFGDLKIDPDNLISAIEIIKSKTPIKFNITFDN